MPDTDPSVARALVNPVGLGVAAGAATVAIALTNPLVGIVGGGIYLFTVAVDAARRSRKNTKRSGTVIHGMPHPDSLKDEDTRTAVKKIFANKKQLQKVLDETPQDVLNHMSRTLSSLDELERHAVRLVERAEDITQHLAKINLPALVTEVKQLAQRAASARDRETRAALDSAKDARMDEIRSLKELRATKDRIEASLMRVIAVLGALPTKIVHMRALDAQAMDRLSGDMSRDLEVVGKELQVSEQIIKQQLVAE
jgi:hypothetical protein